MSLQYIINNEGQYAVPKFRALLNDAHWKELASAARWVLEEGPKPTQIPNPSSLLTEGMTAATAQNILEMDAVVSELPLRNEWRGAYVPDHFTPVLSFPKSSGRNSTQSSGWGWKACEKLAARKDWPTFLSQWSIPHLPLGWEHVEYTQKNVADGQWVVQTYNPDVDLTEAEGYAVFFTDEKLYYSGKDFNSPTLSGAVVFPSVSVAIEQAHDLDKNYIVVRMGLSVLNVAAHSPAAQSDFLTEAINLSQHKRIEQTIGTQSVAKPKAKI